MFLKRFRRPNLENLARMSLIKLVNTACRKVVYCPYCGSTNGTVKKAGLLRIVHEKFRAKKTGEEKEAWKRTFTTAIEHQKEIATFLGKAQDDLNPLKALDLFRRISAEVRSLFCRPESLQLNFGVIGLRVAWVESCAWETRTVSLAVYFCPSCVHSSIGAARWS
jgi:DNA-directed RNA polymerase III subunit RPC1